jgi:hypothetical protein
MKANRPNYKDNSKNCRCCASCKHIEWWYEGESTCNLDDKNNDILSICDAYEMILDG